MKLVPPQSSEAVILKKLLTIEDPRNPILPGIHITKLVSAPSYSLVYMPEGKQIVVYPDHAVHLLDLAIQFVSGVLFLHDHNIAHLDIKKDNLLLSSTTGKLSIIDFSLSRFVENSTTLTGFRGTQGCVAPEIDKGRPFSPFLADRWACGKILEDMDRAHSGIQSAPGILAQALYLTEADPLRRPPLDLVLVYLRGLQKVASYRAPRNLKRNRESYPN